MTIEYSCIARGTTILCSHAIGSGSYERAAENVLPTIPTRRDGKTAFTQDSYTFYCLIENGIIYLCVAKPGFPKQQCYAFLTEIKDQFRNGSASMLAVTARDHELDTEFNRNLVKEMESFSRQGGNSNINKLQSQVKEVQGVMTQNIEKVIERGDKLDDLIDKTDELEAQAGTFQKTASKIRRKYWWKNTKMKLIIAFVILVILIIIVVAILFGTHTIGGGGDSKTTAAPATTTKAPVGR